MELLEATDSTEGAAPQDQRHKKEMQNVGYTQSFEMNAAFRTLCFDMNLVNPKIKSFHACGGEGSIVELILES